MNEQRKDVSKEIQLSNEKKQNYSTMFQLIFLFCIFTYVVLFYWKQQDEWNCIKNMNSYKKIELNDTKCRKVYFNEFLENKNKDQIWKEDFDWIQQYFVDWSTLNDIFRSYCNLDVKKWRYQWTNFNCRDIYRS